MKFNTPMTNASLCPTSRSGFLQQFIRRLWTGGRSNRPAVFVKVWDERSACYRQVNLSNHNDPLWDTAYTVAGLHRRERREQRKRAAA
ncbi:MAG: hypothetical protein EA377_07990 [Phycisphaerales bacterium]|nr:MAG: hypothetical protein EA377_07990 [Phycisphaerales bacterium]